MPARRLKCENRVVLKGYVGKDPELRLMPSGDPVCNFSIATRLGSHVEWHRITVYDALAEDVKATIASKDFVYIEAEIRTRKFQTTEDKAQNRKPREVRELIASDAHVIVKRAAGENDLDTDLEQPEHFIPAGRDNLPEPSDSGDLPGYI